MPRRPPRLQNNRRRLLRRWVLLRGGAGVRHKINMIRCRCARPVTGRPLPLDTDYQAAVEGVDASEFTMITVVLQTVTLFSLQLRTSWWRCRRSRLCPLQLCGSSADASAPMRDQHVARS